jgi:hypothetical protein
MSSIAAYLSAVAVAQNPAAKPVSVSPENPLPVTIVAGGGGVTPVVGPDAVGVPSTQPPVQLGIIDAATGDVVRVQGNSLGAISTVPIIADQRGGATNATTAPFNVLPAPGPGLRIYLLSIQCGYTSNNNVTLSDTDGNLAYYAGGVNNGSFQSFAFPVRLAVNSALIATLGTANSATIYAQYFIGT